MRKAILPWVADASVEEANVQLEGPPEGRRWVIRLNHHDEGLRTRLGVQASGALRMGGSWRQFSGETGNLYVDKDKNGRRRKEEYLAKKIVRHIDPKHKPTIDRRAAEFVSVRINGEKLVEDRSESPEAAVEFSWDNALTKAKTIDPIECEAVALAKTQKSDDDKISGKAQPL